MEELYDDLEDDEKAFFDLLGHELDKVESFYAAREQEAIHRAHDLRDQLRELAEHRKIYHDLYPDGLPEWEVKVGRILPDSVTSSGLAGVAQKLHLRIPFVHEDDQRSNGNPGARAPSPNVMDDGRRSRLRDAMAADKEHNTYSPERYQKYKKELRAAVLEFYRQLELIKNYRVRRTVCAGLT